MAYCNDYLVSSDSDGLDCLEYLQALYMRLHNRMCFIVPCLSTKVGDLEAHSLDLHFHVSSDDEYALTFPGTPTSHLEALSIKWLLETSTDPGVFLAAVSLVPQVEWPLDLDVSDTLHQLYDVLISCVGFYGQIIPSLEEKASACTMALSHLYCGHVLQAYPARGEFLGRRTRDYDTFYDMTLGNIGTANKMVLVSAMQLCSSEDDDLDLGFSWHTFWLHKCPDSVLGWLSHSLPYHFVTGRVNEHVEKIATKVISKLLSSTSSPSNQIVANCTLLACVMIGVQFDKRDIVQIDKSSALPRLSESLLVQFQKVLWAWDEGQLDKDSTGAVCRAWKLLDIICRIIELVRPHFLSSFHIMQNLDVCKRIYSRARSSEQNDASVSLAALRKLWYTGLFLQGGSHSPEDFDWAVDYLDFIHSDDHEAAYDILLLLGSMEVRCSSSKQHLFFESLIACMDDNMPQYLRHAALRAAHNVREEIASIDAIHDAMLRNTVLTKLFPAILSVLCLHPDTTPTNDGPDHFFYESRDFCYLELVFALAGNSDWRSHLSGDRHIDQCFSMIPRYCDPEYGKHAFYIAGIILQIAPEQTSDTSLNSVTEQQWWDVMRCAWNYPPHDFHNTRNIELLLVLVDGTKKYMHIASKSNLEQLIGRVDWFLKYLERDMRWQRRLQELRLETGPEIQSLEQGERIAIVVKALRSAASDMIESFGQQLSVAG
ncbi:uncharacterized protein F5147DRAFT_433432 [Suillus discolor]|uniref:Uncharacterized protein n=1 Tax=Suillus discolor TaxID=1912936 RepID=A0A9P7EWN8_9AGAM|nr:uncharacterized protein F5147DRAFT_433432 [Suillus discolor]KAG2092494.1 hypothetical protein F5147DRAFT_433432 [Suillus discolor]